jgi:NAD(P)-dependent dehydrogenase (short-subunit alcohol dehydrogenase family)
MRTSERVSNAVLVTGCSSGIGRAVARRLADHGWTVYASARRPETISQLAAHGCRLLQLDVCDPDSARHAVEAVEEAEGAVGVLVNNAGYGLEGAVEEISIDEARVELETNFLGPARLIRLVLPGMRRQGRGRIVNMSSVGGRLTVPGGAYYHASKHALEALSDVLRFEVRGFGIDVIVIEPGAVRTRWVDKASIGMASRADPAGPYAAFDDAVARRLRGAHEGVLRLAAKSPEAVARVVERAISARRPRTRYVVPRAAQLFTGSRRVLPDHVWDAFMRRLFPTPGPTP